MLPRKELHRSLQVDVFGRPAVAIIQHKLGLPPNHNRGSYAYGAWNWPLLTVVVIKLYYPWTSKQSFMIWKNLYDDPGRLSELTHGDVGTRSLPQGS